MNLISSPVIKGEAANAEYHFGIPSNYERLDRLLSKIAPYSDTLTLLRQLSPHGATIGEIKKDLNSISDLIKMVDKIILDIDNITAVGADVQKPRTTKQVKGQTYTEAYKLESIKQVASDFHQKCQIGFCFVQPSKTNIVGSQSEISEDGVRQGTWAMFGQFLMMTFTTELIRRGSTKSHSPSLPGNDVYIDTDGFLAKCKELDNMFAKSMNLALPHEGTGNRLIDASPWVIWDEKTNIAGIFVALSLSDHMVDILSRSYSYLSQNADKEQKTPSEVKELFLDILSNCPENTSIISHMVEVNNSFVKSEWSILNAN